MPVEVSMRVIAIGLLMLVAGVASTSVAQAQPQGFGLGGRFAMVRNDVETDTTAERFTGGHIRARLSPRLGLELSLDRRTESNTPLTERVRDSPLQASLLMYPWHTAFAPYLLGGAGWYSHRVEALVDNKVVSSDTSRKFGYHAGFGAELGLGRHAGIHADYRYTFLRFGDDSEDAAGAAPQQNGRNGLSPILPSYKGSMWTAGLTVYF